MEGPAENTVGGGAEGDWEVEEPVEDPGPPGGREVREFLGEQGAGAEEPGTGVAHCSCPRPTSWRPQERCRRWPAFLPFSFLGPPRSFFFLL